MTRSLLQCLALALLSHAALAQSLTGTPAELQFGTSANPVAQNVMTPADLTEACYFWAGYISSGGQGLASVTLAGNAPSMGKTLELNASGDTQNVGGVACWNNPAQGASLALDPAWDTTWSEGPVGIVFFIKDHNTAAWRDGDIAAQAGSTATGVTLTGLTAGDLVVKLDKNDAIPPNVTAGWTGPDAEQTVTSGSDSVVMSHITATGASQACNAENDAYSVVVCLAFAPVSASTDPEITSVTPDTFEDTDTGIVIAGSNFEASQGTGTVVICPTDDIMDADCEAQTVTAWADDEITFTAVQGANASDMTAFLFVTNDTGDSNADGFEVTFSSGAAQSPVPLILQQIAANDDEYDVNAR